VDDSELRSSERPQRLKDAEDAKKRTTNYHKKTGRKVLTVMLWSEGGRIC